MIAPGVYSDVLIEDGTVVQIGGQTPGMHPTLLADDGDQVLIVCGPTGGDSACKGFHAAVYDQLALGAARTGAASCRPGGTSRAGRGDVKRKVAINPQTMGNYKKIKSITLRMEPSGTTWAAFLRGQAGKEEIYQVEILLCILCNKLKLRRCVNG